MSIVLGGTPVAQMADGDLVAWMHTRKGGYRLRPDTAAIWVAVVRSFDQQGVPMTVRGLFYNCENVYHVVPKTEQGYEQVARQVLAMRRCGVLPYSFVSDGTRWVRKPDSWHGLGAFLHHGQQAYRRALWDSQSAYVEVWCEKDAVAGILYAVTATWDVPLYVVRGYSSETFMYNAAEQLKAEVAGGREAFIYYFGDFDPHGLGISADVERKLRGFGAAFAFERLAVTARQIAEWHLPTRPPKPRDPRSRNWGNSCVEVDAIPANRLRSLTEAAIVRYIDQGELARLRQVEALERESLAHFEASLQITGVG